MTLESEIKINVCLQKKLGSCAGCPALSVIQDLVDTGLSVSDAKKEIGVCPDGYYPQLDKLVNCTRHGMGQ